MDNKYRVAIRIPYLKLLMRNVTSCYAEKSIPNYIILPILQKGIDSIVLYHSTKVQRIGN